MSGLRAEVGYFQTNFFDSCGPEFKYPPCPDLPKKLAEITSGHCVNGQIFVFEQKFIFLEILNQFCDIFMNLTVL